MAEIPEKFRAFLAIRLNDQSEVAIANLIDEARRESDGIRWVSRKNLHLTLKFLGPAVARAKIEALINAVGPLAKATAPFDLAARGVGGFPNLERPRVVWVGLEGPALNALASRVEDAAAACGFDRERRAFSAHLTIGRVNSLRGYGRTLRLLEAARDRDFGTSRIDSVTLYRSTLATGGSLYTPIRVLQFAVERP